MIKVIQKSLNYANEVNKLEKGNLILNKSGMKPCLRHCGKPKSAHKSN